MKDDPFAYVIVSLEHVKISLAADPDNASIKQALLTALTLENPIFRYYPITKVLNVVSARDFNILLEKEGEAEVNRKH